MTTCLSGCDRVFIFEPADQGAGTHEQASLDEIMARVRAAGVDATPIHSCDEGLAKIGAELRKDDAVLFLTSGDIGGLIEQLPPLAEKQYPLHNSASERRAVRSADSPTQRRPRQSRPRVAARPNRQRLTPCSRRSMWTIRQTGQFGRDLKRQAKGRHREVLSREFVEIVASIAKDQPLSEELRDHRLSEQWRDCRDCHIRPDLVSTSESRTITPLNSFGSTPTANSAFDWAREVGSAATAITSNAGAMHPLVLRRPEGASKDGPGGAKDCAGLLSLRLKGTQRSNRANVVCRQVGTALGEGTLRRSASFRIFKRNQRRREKVRGKAGKT